MIYRRSVRTRQPHPAAEMDKRFRGVSVVLPGRGHDLACGLPLIGGTNSSTLLKSASLPGHVFKTSGNYNRISNGLSEINLLSTTVPFAVQVVFRLNALDITQVLFASMSTSGFDGISIGVSNTNVLRCNIRNSGGAGQPFANGPVLELGRWYSAMMQWLPGVGYGLHLDGQQVAWQANTTTARYQTNGMLAWLWYGSYNAPLYPPNAELALGSVIVGDYLAQGASISANPWQIFKKKTRTTFLQSSGGADLAAAATAQSSATAALDKALTLATAAAAQATAGADLLLGVSLAASGLSVAAASAQISKTAPLAAAAAVVASGTAGLHLVIDLAGAALVQAVSAASLALGKDLAALGLAQASATAALDVSAGGAVSLAANALAQAGGEATLSLAVQLSAAAMAQVQASATLGSAVIQLGASAQANASGGATLWLQVPLAAAALASAIGSAQVQLVVDLAAHASAQATATGAAQASLVLLADAAVVAVSTAALRVTPPQVVVVGSPKFRVVATGRRFVARAQRRVFRVVA